MNKIKRVLKVTFIAALMIAGITAFSGLAFAEQLDGIDQITSDSNRWDLRDACMQYGDYTVEYVNNKSVGTAKVIFRGIGNFKGTKTETFKINKRNNTLTAGGKKITVNKSAVKKKNKKITRKKAITVSKAIGKVTYKKAGGNKKLTVAKNGTITIRKGLSKGTYTLKVKVTAAGNTTYKAKTKTVAVKIKVK